jgi:hypothetical protein
MRLEMIGVQFDQAGHDQVAAGVRAACGRVTLPIPGDAVIRKSDPAAFDHAIRQNNPGIADNGFEPGRSHISGLPSCRGGKRGHVDDPVGDQMTDFIVMDNGDDGNTRALLFVDQIYHDRAIGRIQGRATRLIRSARAPRKAVAAA